MRPVLLPVMFSSTATWRYSEIALSRFTTYKHYTRMILESLSMKRVSNAIMLSPVATWISYHARGQQAEKRKKNRAGIELPSGNPAGYRVMRSRPLYYRVLDSPVYFHILYCKYCNHMKWRHLPKRGIGIFNQCQSKL